MCIKSAICWRSDNGVWSLGVPSSPPDPPVADLLAIDVDDVDLPDPAAAVETAGEGPVLLGLEPPPETPTPATPSEDVGVDESSAASRLFRRFGVTFLSANKI